MLHGIMSHDMTPGQWIIPCILENEDVAIRAMLLDMYIFYLSPFGFLELGFHFDPYNM